MDVFDLLARKQIVMIFKFGMVLSGRAFLIIIMAYQMRRPIDFGIENKKLGSQRRNVSRTNAQHVHR